MASGAERLSPAVQRICFQSLSASVYKCLWQVSEECVAAVGHGQIGCTGHGGPRCYMGPARNSKLAPWSILVDPYLSQTSRVSEDP